MSLFVANASMFGSLYSQYIKQLTLILAAHCATFWETVQLRARVNQRRFENIVCYFDIFFR